ncbi:MAG: response regulator [Deltaproteobacteria bacterium]|nr:response regulator [Deltaproteobacteria bacterium]
MPDKTMIEDAELRELFKTETAEHLQGLEKGLLRLETAADDSAALDDVFREAHSIKGASRMVGARDIELAAHKVEDTLGAVKKGELAFTPGLFDAIYKALDAIRALAAEAVTGKPSGADTAEALRRLSKAASGRDAEAALAASGPGYAEDKDAEGVRPEPPASFKDAYRIDTIRVPTRKLDELMTHASELGVVTASFHHLRASIDEAVELLARLHAQLPDGARDAEYIKRLATGLAAIKEAAHEGSGRLALLANALEDGIRDMRMLPLATVFGLFPRMIRDLGRGRGVEIDFRMEGGDTLADKRVIEEMKDPLMHLLRNAVDHGMEPPDKRAALGKPRKGAITIRASGRDKAVVIEVSDDGRGLDVEEIKRRAVKAGAVQQDVADAMTGPEAMDLVFAPGVSTSRFVTDTSGRGVGLDVVRANAELLKGGAAVESTPGKGCLFRITLPAAITAVRALIARAGQSCFVIPAERVMLCRLVSPEDVFTVEGRDAIMIDGAAVPVAHLDDLLGLGPAPGRKRVEAHGRVPCVVIREGDAALGMFVDELVGEQEVAQRGPPALLKRVPNVGGVTVLANGEVGVILAPRDLLKTMGASRPAQAHHEEKPAEPPRKRAVLLVEDSITTRTQERRILEGAGYEVTTAVDGLDALGKLSARAFDAVVTDIMMPNMDGLALTGRIRRDAHWKDMPVVLVTTLASDEDKKRGLDAGANAYIPKPAFDQKMLIETLRRLI